MNFKTSNTLSTPLAAAILIAGSAMLSACGPVVSSANAHVGTPVVTASAVVPADDYSVIQATLGVDTLSRAPKR